MVVRNSGMELAMALMVAPLMPGGNFLPRKSDATSNPWEDRQMMRQLAVMSNRGGRYATSMRLIELLGFWSYKHDLVIQEIVLVLCQESPGKAADPSF